MNVLVGSIQVGCVLDDPKECERRDYPQSFRESDARRPAGPLRFKIQSWWARPNTGQQWDDSGDIKLESMLTDIVVQILASGEITLRAWSQDRYEDELKRRAEAAEKARLKREPDERKERERIAKLEQDGVDQLIRSAASWRQAGEIRAYVRAAMGARHCSRTEHVRIRAAAYRRAVRCCL